MSFFPAQDPAPGDKHACEAIDQVIVPRTSDIGGFSVRRALPSARRRMVGPFIFLDHMGPAEFRAEQGIDVRPHPHIGLSTVTYLFDGEIVHRDSIGSVVPIRPGAVNWMTAGRGIAHSERTASEHRVAGEPLHGLQCWVALSQNDEESAPGFAHHDELPIERAEGKTIRVIAGKVYGLTSPVATTWETVFADVTLESGAKLPIDAETEERALYLVAGEIDIAVTASAQAAFDPAARGPYHALCHCTVPARAARRRHHGRPRHIWWNFVSSRKDRIEQAKADWKSGASNRCPATSNASRCRSNPHLPEVSV